MDAVLLVLATLLGIVFIISIFAGEQHSGLAAGLDSDLHPLRFLYVSGFFLSGLKPFALKGSLKNSLAREMSILHGAYYHEYYMRAAWAQFLSLSLFSSFSILGLAALIGGEISYILAVAAVVVLHLIWKISAGQPRAALAARREECLYEFPEMVTKLALLINSGMVLREAWRLIAFRKEGTIYSLMKKTIEMMDNGESDVDAIHYFGYMSDTPEIKKFAGAMIQGIEKGNAELVDFLMGQASELWARKRQLALQKGEIAAGKLVAPLGLSFIGIIIIVVSGALQGLKF
ncbi:MAG: type II secretion system F family protein [Clostridiales bacterium]|nr:type II secretion system F family protein [Clostridiales bacterium]